MNELVERELVDLARVELGEAVTDSFEQCSELLPVIGGDQLAGGSTLRLIAVLRTLWLGHDPKLQPGRPSGLEGPRRRVSGVAAATTLQKLSSATRLVLSRLARALPVDLLPTIRGAERRGRSGSARAVATLYHAPKASGYVELRMIRLAG